MHLSVRSPTFQMTSSTKASDKPSFTFCESEFREHIVNYLCVLSCKYIGDDVAYIRYMQKQAAAGNEHAMAGVKALCFIESLHQHIDQHIKYFEAIGHARIVEVCRAIKLLEHIPTTFSQHWNMCALTGVNTNNALVIDRAEHNPLFIDASFASFATMLWLLAHIDAVEYNRTMEFVNQTPTDQSIRTTIAAYQQHLHAHSEHLTNLYFHAASYTLQCIHTTTLHIESQKLSPNST